MFSSHPTSIQRLNRAGLTIPKGVTIHVAIECPPEGRLTINACGRTGTTILYLSKSSTPNSANYEEILRIMDRRCRNTLIECDPGIGRRKRLTDQRIYMTVEGVGENNRYDLKATAGDVSTPQGK